MLNHLLICGVTMFFDSYELKSQLEWTCSVEAELSGWSCVLWRKSQLDILSWITLQITSQYIIGKHSLIGDFIAVCTDFVSDFSHCDWDECEGEAQEEKKTFYFVITTCNMYEFRQSSWIDCQNLIWVSGSNHNCVYDIMSYYLW